MEGVTFAPFVGVPGAMIPPMPIHYALLGACMTGVERTYFVCYLHEYADACMTGVERTYPQSYAIYMAMLTFMQVVNCQVLPAIVPTS
jgi:hypothetical protein